MNAGPCFIVNSFLDPLISRVPNLSFQKNFAVAAHATGARLFNVGYLKRDIQVAGTQPSKGLLSFRGDMRSFGGDGSFHEEDQADHCKCNYGEDKERIEVGEGGGLLRS